MKETPSDKTINSIADGYLDYMDANAYHLIASRNDRIRQLNKGNVNKNDMEVKWGLVEVSKLIKPYLLPDESKENSLTVEELEISPTLIYSVVNKRGLFFEEISLYSNLLRETMIGNIYRPMVPLTPRMISFLCSMVVNHVEKVDDVWVTNFPVSNNEPDWEKFKEIAHQVTNVYVNPCYDLQKIRQPEGIDIGLRESTVATFSEQLKETRQETFDYFRVINDFGVLLKHIQRFNQGDKFSPRMIVLLNDLLGDHYETSLTNILDSTARVYALNYPQELYVNSVKDMVEHFKELLEDLDKDLRKPTEGGFTYSYENLPGLFSFINLLLEFLHEVVEIPQYSFHAMPKHIEF